MGSERVSFYPKDSTSIGFTFFSFFFSFMNSFFFFFYWWTGAFACSVFTLLIIKFKLKLLLFY